jgi:hypothetical protein
MSQSQARRARRAQQRASGISVAQKRAATRQMCRKVATIDAPLHLEMWASWLLGMIWEDCAVELSDGRIVRAFQGGMRNVDEIARVREPGAMMALLALDGLDQGPIGERAWELALRVSDYSLPTWIPWVGHADIARAMVASSSDGDLLLIEAWRPDESHTIGAYIDHRLGGIAKHLGLIRPIDYLLEHEWESDEGESFMHEMRVVDPAWACRHLREAIELTDASLDPPVGERFAELRALALSRASILQ